MKLGPLNPFDHPHRAIEHLGYFQQQHLIEVARRRAMQRPKWWLNGAALGLPLVAGSLMLLLNWAPPLKIALGLLVVAQAGLLWSWPRRARRMFLAELRIVLLSEGIRPAVCLVCEYDLRGCPSDRCPECGASLAMASVVAPPRPPE